MASNVMIGFLVGIGFGGWLFAKVQRRTGQDTRSSIIVAVMAGLIAWGLMTIILDHVIKK